MYAATVILGVTAAFAALASHELGHLTAGLLVGFDFSLFIIGPLLIDRAPSGSLRLGWNGTLAFAGGMAATFPKDSHRLRARFGAVVAGGPIASLLLAIAAAATLIVVPPSYPLVRIEISWLRLLSALVFVGTSIPIPNGAFVSDGLRFLRITHGGPHGDRELALITLVCSQFTGVRPRDWDKKLIRRALTLRDSSMFECQMQLYSFFHAIDSGELAEAADSIENALALVPKVPDSLKADCLLEAAYFESAFLNRPSKARALLARLPSRAYGVLESDRFRALGALALSEQDFSSARTLLQRAIACAPSWASGPKAWLTQLLASLPPEG